MKFSRCIDERVKKIALDFIWNCPSSIQKGKQWYPVSKRKCSFRKRGIKESLLRTILSQIKKQLPSKEFYVKIKSGESVEEKVINMEKTSVLSDSRHEYIVLCNHSSMSETEAVFYYIRNAFAHGAFSVEDTNEKGWLYYLESEKEGTLKAKMLLKESTLIEYSHLMKLTPNEIKSFRKR